MKKHLVAGYSIMLKIKSKIHTLAFNALLSVYKIYADYILKIRSEHAQALSLKANILALSLFPEKKLSQSGYLAQFVVSNILKISYEEKEHLSNKDAEILNSALMKNEWAIKTIENYHLLEALYFFDLLEYKSEDIRKKFDEAFNQAKLYNKDSKLLVKKDLANLKKKNKKNIKDLKKDIKYLQLEKIKTEKLKKIKPIAFSLINVLSFVTFYSFVWLFGGIIYNWIFFSYSFDINISDFFELADYVGSDMGVLLTGVILTIILTWAVRLRQTDDMEDGIASEQYDIPARKQYDKLILFILFLVSIVQYYLYGNFIIFLVFICLVVMKFFWSFSHYIENKLHTYWVLLPVVLFLSYIVLTAIDDANKAKNSAYVSPYDIVLKDGYKSFSNHIFIKSNLNYIFLLDKNNKMTVIKKTNVKSFSAK